MISILSIESHSRFWQWLRKQLVFNSIYNWTKTWRQNMMSLKEWSLAHKINEPTSELITFTISLQVPIRRVPVISTVWSATITAPTPTKLSLTADSIRSWTASWLPASRSSPRPSTAPSTAAVTPGSRPTTTAGSASTLCWACPRWRPTSTDTWMSNCWTCWRADRQLCLSCPGCQASALRLAAAWMFGPSQHARLTWETGSERVTSRNSI